MTLGWENSTAPSQFLVPRRILVTKDIVTFNSPSDTIQILVNVENPAGSTCAIFLCLSKLKCLFSVGVKTGLENRLPFPQMEEESSANVGTFEKGRNVGKGLNELEHKKPRVWDYSFERSEAS